jgi:hypothetical protein
MKLLQELLSLREEAIEVKPADEVWTENKDEANTYVPTATYVVRKIKSSDPTRYEVFVDKDSKRTLVGKMDGAKLEAGYAPVRPNQTPDAEGFTTYRENLDLEAFKYTGDTIKVDLDGEKKTLAKGDYLLRHTEDDEFTYSVEAAEDFESDYAEQK